MGKAVHSEWDGFIQVRNKEGKIIGAHCLSCKKTRSKRDSASLAKHRQTCKGINAQPLQESNANKENLDMSDEEIENVGTATTKNTETASVDSTLNSSTLSSHESPHIVKDVSPKSVLIKRESDYNKNVLIMKFFVVCGINLEKIKSVHCRNMFQAFDPNFNLPTVEEFRTTILKNTHDELCKEISTFNYSNIISIQTYDAGQYTHALSLAMHSKTQYVYIDYCTINKVESDLKKQLENFSDKSVKKFHDEHKVSIKYVIYDGTTLLTSDGTIDNIQYVRIPCMSFMLYTLKHDHEPFLITGIDDADKPAKYYKRIDELTEKFKSSECTLGEATQDILESYNQQIFQVSASMEKVIFSFITGVALAANFFNPKYKGNYFIDAKDITDIMMMFIDEYLPVDAFDGLAAYKANTQVFERLDTEKKKFDYKRFWSIASVDFQSLSEFAMQLYDIPAIPRQINMSKFIRLEAQLSKTSSVCDKMLLISLFLNEDP